ncbi:hypothetical protein Q5752_001603 [Cryptotrichosporon argae]
MLIVRSKCDRHIPCSACIWRGHRESCQRQPAIVRGKLVDGSPVPQEPLTAEQLAPLRGPAASREHAAAQGRRELEAQLCDATASAAAAAAVEAGGKVRLDASTSSSLHPPSRAASAFAHGAQLAADDLPIGPGLFSVISFTASKMIVRASFKHAQAAKGVCAEPHNTNDDDLMVNYPFSHAEYTSHCIAVTRLFTIDRDHAASMAGAHSLREQYAIAMRAAAAMDRSMALFPQYPAGAAAYS